MIHGNIFKMTILLLVLGASLFTQPFAYSNSSAFNLDGLVKNLQQKDEKVRFVSLKKELDDNLLKMDEEQRKCVQRGMLAVLLCTGPSLEEKKYYYDLIRNEVNALRAYYLEYVQGNKPIMMAEDVIDWLFNYSAILKCLKEFENVSPSILDVANSYEKYMNVMLAQLDALPNDEKFWLYHVVKRDFLPELKMTVEKYYPVYKGVYSLNVWVDSYINRIKEFREQLQDKLKFYRK